MTLYHEKVKLSTQYIYLSRDLQGTMHKLTEKKCESYYRKLFKKIG